jgi:hypothetical protein
VYWDKKLGVGEESKDQRDVGKREYKVNRLDVHAEKKCVRAMIEL